MVAAGEPATPTLPTTTPAEAAPSASSIVAVRRPPPGDTVLEEAGSRIRSELSAMGLEGQFVDCPPNAASGRGDCPDVAAPAIISLTRDDGVVEIGVRTVLPDGLELSRHVRVLSPDGGDDPLRPRRARRRAPARFSGSPPGGRPRGARADRRATMRSRSCRRRRPFRRAGACRRGSLCSRRPGATSRASVQRSGRRSLPAPSSDRAWASSSASPDRSTRRSAPSTRGPRRCSRLSPRWSSASAWSPWVRSSRSPPSSPGSTI